MNNLSVDGEFRYIVNWFNEFSELQRDDFVAVVVEALTKDAEGAVYMNGVVSSMATTNINEKPMSLFQCRIKLFREWTAKWPVELKHKLKDKIMEIDSNVGEKITQALKGHEHPMPDTLNGYSNVEGDSVSTATITTIAAALEEAGDSDSRLSIPFDEEAQVDVSEVQAVPIENAPAEPAEQVPIQTQELVSSRVVGPTVSSNAEVPSVA